MPICMTEQSARLRSPFLGTYLQGGERELLGGGRVLSELFSFTTTQDSSLGPVPLKPAGQSVEIGITKGIQGPTLPQLLYRVAISARQKRAVPFINWLLT